MASDPQELAYNIELGYTMTLPTADATVANRRLYHGRLGGDMTALQDAPMYFYAEGEWSSVFSEHIFLNGEATYEIASAAETEEAFNNAYLAQTPIVFPLLVTIDKPVILDMPQLLAIAQELGVAEGACDTFVSEFEDSVLDYRERVFAWARSRGYSGAIIVNDMTPVVAGGDWGFRTSYVAFEPRKQVRFAFESFEHKVKKPASGASLGM